MNEQTRHFAHMTAGAIVSLGRRYAKHFDSPVIRMRFDCIAQGILDMHKDGTIDFEGFVPTFPDTRGMRPLEAIAAFERNVIEHVDHIVAPDRGTVHALTYRLLRQMDKASRGCV